MKDKSITELQDLHKLNLDRILELEREIEILEGNLTCHCAKCLQEPPLFSTPIPASLPTFPILSDVISMYGPFDAILMDPPWQLAGTHPTRGVALAYPQMSDSAIQLMDVASNHKGLLFLWTINNKFAFALDLMRRWGYTYVQDIVWVKRTVNRRLAKCHGYYLQHAKETCLVGIKNGVDPSSFDNEGISTLLSDVIYTERRGQSQKPQELYEMIEKLIPNGKYLEIFGRRHNLRDHWVTIGNEL